MKHTYLFLIAAIFAACNKAEVPQPDYHAKADFTYFTNGLSCSFKNTSSNELTPYRWDFGDGKFVSGGNTTTHNYARSGTYTVTLSCQDKNSYRYSTSKQVTVSDKGGSRTGDQTGKTLYFTGFKFYSIPSNANGYLFNCTLYGHDLWGNESPHVSSGYSAISRNRLPYTIVISSPERIAEFPNPFDYYKDMKVTVSYVKEGDDTYNFYSHNLNPATMKEAENIVTFSNGIELGLLFEYR